MAIEKKMFSEVKLGKVFHHNRVGYTKVSRDYAEVNDNTYQQAQGNRYFHATQMVEPAAH